MRVGAQRHLDVEFVAADQPARWVHQHVVAHALRLGVQAREHAQRSVVPVMHDRARLAAQCLAAVGELQ